ncbi:AAA family ATPase [Lysobacter enzymogenes]|uniref:AAA family ATPase n=1 Tax=Lysobacter enzymogenes TaxID=69 RepID=UPI003748D285
MDLRIVGWSYKNIRGMRDVQIQLGDLPAQWTLIQMPNGTGKTTTLTLMRLALSGEAPDPQVVRSFRPDDLTVSGEFVLRITVDGDKCWLILQFDYVEGTMRPYTSRASLDSGGYEPGRRLKRDLQDLLTTAFTRLFVFDGELAKSIRDLSKDEASRAIRTLYQLDRVAQLRKSAQRILDEEQEASVRTGRGHSNIAGRLKTAETKLRVLKDMKKELEASRADLAKKISALDARRQERISVSAELGERLNAVNAKRTEISTSLQGLTSQVAELSRNPAAISQVIQVRLHGLAARLHKLKLPKTTSSEFFHELAKAPECICGRPIGPYEKCQIEARASEYLGTDQVAVINAMKEALRTSVADPGLLVEGVEKIKALMRQRKQVEFEFDRICAEREEQGDDEIEAIRIDLESSRTAFDEQERKFLALTATSKVDQQGYDVDWSNNIPLCEKQVAEAKAALTAATNTMRLMEQSAFVQDALQSVEKRAYEALRDRVQESTNAKLKTLLPGEGIRVSEIGSSLLLSTDALASKDSVSEGQGLAVAYAFLASLFEDAPYRLPFVVDSPAVSLDTLVRREVAELIPNLFGQAIFFVISSEREGFAESFYGRSGAKFITVETGKDGHTCVEEGIEPFRAFHSDEDEPQLEAKA